MGIEIPPGYGQAKLIFSLAGDVEEMVSTFGFDHSLNAVPGYYADAIRLLWIANFTAGDLSNAYSFLGVECTVNTGGVLHTGESRVTTAGGLAGAPLPQNCALLLKKVTNAGGREGRGRMYLPAGYLPEGSVSSIGVVDPSAVTAYQTKATDFLGDMDTAGHAMVLLHGDPTNTPDEVTGLTVDRIIATQRSRLRGR